MEVHSKILTPLETTGGNSFHIFTGGVSKNAFLILNFTQGDLHSTGGGIHISFQGVYNSTGGIQISFLWVYNSESLQWNYKPLGRISKSLQWNYKPQERISEFLQWNYKTLGRISESLQWNYKPPGQISEPSRPAVDCKSLCVKFQIEKSDFSNPSSEMKSLWWSPVESKSYYELL